MSPSLKCYRRKAARFRQQGLTTKGTPFRRTPNYKTKADRIDARRRRGLLAWERLIMQRRLGGLTVRGGKRIYRIARADALVVASSIHAALKSISENYKFMPTPTKGKCLDVANHLTAILKELKK